MTGSVSIDIDMLKAAHTAVTALAGRIDAQRARVTSGTPISLSTLQEGGNAARTSDWLTTEAPNLQTVIDLAVLLDTEGTGSASYEGGGSFADVESRLGSELGNQLGDLDIDDPEDRERYQQLADLMVRYKDNQGVTSSTLDTLGTDGVNEVLHKLVAMTGVPPNTTYWDSVQPPATPGDEKEALGTLQATVATGLSGMLASATRNDWVDQKSWGEGIGGDWTAAAILLRSADKNNFQLGGKFAQTTGHELLEYEAGDPMRHQGLTAAGSTFGGEKLYDENHDALLQLVKASDNSRDSAQSVMQDTELASYLMHDRLTSEFLADDMDDLVRVATVDSAMDPTGDRAKNAADISSWTLKYAGENGLDDKYDEELGGIMGTYMPDVYHTITGADVRSITGDVPPFQLDVEKSDLTEVMTDIGGNETARSIIGDHASRLNQVLINHGAQESLAGRASGDPAWGTDTDGDPMMLGIHGAAQFRGFLEDGLAHGMKEDGVEEAEARRKTAELFTLPMDFIDTGGLKAGAPLGDFLLGDIKDQIIDGYVGDPAHAAAVEGNEHYDTARRATTVQAFYALASAEGDGPPAHPGQHGVETGPDGNTVFATQLHHDWPTDQYGTMLTPGELSEAQVESLISKHTQEAGTTGATATQIDQSWDNQENAEDTD